MHDVTPAVLRHEWLEAGYYAGQDLFTIFASQAAAHAGDVAVIDDSGATTYGRLLEAVERTATVLSDHGLGSGDVVGVQLPNSWMGCVLDFAIAAVGAVSLPYPVHYREQETRMLLGQSGATAAVVIRSFDGHDHRQMLERLQPELPHLRTIFGVAEHGGAPSLDEALSPGPSQWTPRDLSPAAPVRVITTSGTEAAPKMVLYSHDAVGRPMRAVAERLRLRPGAKALFLVPLPSALGLVASNGVVAGHGATMVVTSAFTPERGLQLIAEHGVTHVLGVPTVFQLMLSHPRFEQYDVSSVEVVVTGGAAAAPVTIDEIRRRFGCDYATWYGSSDGSFCFTRFDDPPARVATTVGRPDPAVSELRVVDDKGNDQPAGQEGEVWARGPFTPLCYLAAEDLDRRYRSSDGWVKTGDVGVLDDEGYLRIAGRLKDIIIRGGYNISPVEIEEHISAHPAVVMAACVGVPDERLGERIAAVLVLRDGAEAPTVESLGQFLLGRGLAKNKLPERIVVADALPVSPIGKVLKRVLREQLSPCPDRG